MNIFFAILCGLVGILLLLGGFRLARFLIPLWGFVAGLSLGGAIVSDMTTTPFLATILGVSVGIIAGLVMAVFAYLYYSVAVIVLAGALGYWVGSGFIQLLGFNVGVISTFVGLSLGVIVGLFALFGNAPKYVLITLTSIAGAMISVGGVLLLFNVIPLSQFNYAVAHAAISNSFIWTLVTVALAIAGGVAQVRTTQNYDFETWDLDSGTKPMPPAPTMTTPQP